MVLWNLFWCHYLIDVKSRAVGTLSSEKRRYARVSLDMGNLSLQPLDLVVWDCFYTSLKCHLYYTMFISVNVYLLEPKHSSSTFAKK